MYLIGEDDSGFVGGVDAVGLDGDQKLASVFEIHVDIFRDDPGLVRLCDISEDDVDHAHQKPVVVGFSGIVDDGDDVGSLLSHVHEVTTHSVRELHSVDHSGRADDVGNVGDCGAGSSAEVEHFAAWADADLSHTACN